MTVVVVSHPEEAIFITRNSHTIIELVRECVNKVVVWTVDPEMIVTTILTDGDVALSINAIPAGRLSVPQPQLVIGVLSSVKTWMQLEPWAATWRYA